MIERVERAMVLLAYFIELDGDVHVPMFEKFETELQELKKTENAKSRARQLLARHGLWGGSAAIGSGEADSKSSQCLFPSVGRQTIERRPPSAALTVDPAS